MEVFIARYSRWRLGLLFALALGFVALGFFLMFETGDGGGIVIGGLSTGFFGLCALLIGRKAFDTRVQLRIDRQGVFTRGWSDGVIGWDGISEVSTWHHRGQRFIILSLEDRAVHPPRPGLAAWTAGINRRLTGGDVPIALTGMDRGFDEAFAAIEHFRKAAREGSSASPGP
ncbi:STM3941 family protein [Erythrobacter sp.]|uniref:STM3941 family protein n=1 Tax=Erythrobacter sp. TaxID=1042 RepID=UPI001425D0BB|nr:STM3941 family protein [Erythrobacter sp.]QIQ86631.1 MAG: hypothetical protein G9473_07990 [Erythrobacter sp.]